MGQLSLHAQTACSRTIRSAPFHQGRIARERLSIRMSMSELAKSLERSFGQGAVDNTYNYQLNAIPTGSLALDYALGTGGWPRGHLTGIFGPRDIGKSVMALHAVASAQRIGLNAVWIAIEPGFDSEWARKHGVDLTPEKFFIVRPDNGED